MKMMVSHIFLILLLPVLCTAETSPIINPELPANGVKTMDLHELWRVGGEDEDIIFGRIVDVKLGPDGNTYVLDNQLCQVMVFSEDGEHLRDLSREGDGPGELRQPVGLAFLSPGILGIGMGFPGKMITLKLDGTPIESLYPIGVPSEGNIGLLMGVEYLDGILVACGGRLAFGNDGQGHTDRFLSICNADCSETKHIIEKATPIDLTGSRFVEAEGYYIDRVWTLGPQGLIYAAPKRDHYEISVFDKTGNCVQIFGRQYKPRKRTRDEKEEVRPVINLNSSPNLEVVAEDYDACISRLLFNHDQNEIWILPPQGNNDQPDGILETWDVFSVAGEFLNQATIPLGNEMNDGSIYLVGNSRLIVVKGTDSSFDDGGNPEEDPESLVVEPLEVICYEIR